MSTPTTEQIHHYGTSPARIGTAIEGLSEEQMKQRPAEGEWSIHEIILHLGDSEVICYERIHRILAEDRPILYAFSEEAWARNLLYPRQNSDTALALFKALRHSSSILLHMLPAEAWERTGVHSERGEMSLYDVFLTFTKHADDHLAQIQRTKQALAVPSSHS